MLRESDDEEYMIPVNVRGGRLPVDLLMSVSALEEGTAGWEPNFTQSLNNSNTNGLLLTSSP